MKLFKLFLFALTAVLFTSCQGFDQTYPDGTPVWGDYTWLIVAVPVAVGLFATIQTIVKNGLNFYKSKLFYLLALGAFAAAYVIYLIHLAEV